MCVLDDQDHEYLKQEFGGDANRGVHWPIRGSGVTLWPWYMHDLIAPPIGDGNVAWPFACVIYLHGSTCETDIGLTLTFAHELQHFIQYAHKKRLWALNTLLTNLGSDDFKVWWDFPIEVDARRTAKLVAEELHGSRPVMEYISCRISARVTDTDADDWRFVQSIDTSFPYDLAERTRPLVKKYKAQLAALLQERGVDPDFADVDLDA